MKKILVACISFLLLIFVMILLIIFFNTESIVKNENKIQIVSTLFPQYDFAKKILGDKGDVKLLLNSGIEAHNYEPTAKDMITIVNNTDLFIFTGTDLEPWTSNIIENLKDSNRKIIDLSKNIDLIKIEDFEKRHINSAILKDNEEEHHEEEIYDEHIWLNPLNAVKMIDEILNAICEIDSENSDYYKNNADNYKNEILNLDERIREVVENSTRKEIAIGGEFAYAYFIEEYNLDFVSVYNNCGDGEDPSISKVKSVIDYINENNLSVVFYEELSEGTIAKMIAEETEARPLVLYSIHNGDTEKDSYVSLMSKNIENLKEALK